ncbi:hypothetical protein [Paenibacillus dendritiformis]|uniref:hypothetical protein n=1 Tax=Paenibacillus dendritiformis TaxID=130049 RepID=UPI001EE64AD7|nr:hypothetical protein [Paenibacillus dendritiformis]CAH8767399.1 hypothetical protein H7S4_000069 [Paenibacillus dendritiformis]
MIFLKISVDGTWEEKEFQSAKEVNDFWVSRTIPILEADRLIYYVEIDGDKYYSDYESIILENYQSINEIYIVTHTKKECFTITLEDLRTYLPRVVNELPGISERLYAEEINDIGSLITPVIDSLQWIVSALEFAYVISEKVNEASQIRYSLEQMYKNIESFVEKFHYELSWNNYVSVSDLLQYELVPILEGWINELEKE